MKFTLTKDQLKKDRTRFSGNSLAVYKRDGYCCVGCNMTMDEHLLKYGKRLTINHIDGSGRKKKHLPGEPENHANSNNNMSNLETVCLRCHGAKDGPRTTANQFGAF